MNRLVSTLAVSLCLAALYCSPIAHAQPVAPPNVINFQGRLATPSGNPVPNGTYLVLFRFYDAASGGTTLFSKAIPDVAVRNGTFAVKINGFTADQFNGNVWLGIKVGSDAELTPRQQIVSIPYAIKSNLALTVPDGSITNDKLAGNITADKLAANALNGTAWLLSGNSGTAGKSLGTKDSQPLTFITRNAERMRILPDGNVGIGTTNPPWKLTIRDDNFDDAPSQLAIQGQSNPNQQLLIGFHNFSNYGSIQSIVQGQDFVPLVLNPIAGNVGIGTILPKATLHVNGNYYGKGLFFLHAEEGDGSDGTAYVQARDDSTTSSISMILRTKQGTTLRDNIVLSPDGRMGVNGLGYADVTLGVHESGLSFAIGTLGKIVGSQFITASDARLKEHIETVPDALSTLLALRGVSYDWNPNVPNAIKGQQERQYGFLAQEVEQILPALVHPGLNGYKAINYQGIIPVTVEAIKAQQSQISALRRENDAIRNENAAIRASLDGILKRLDAMERKELGIRN